MLCTDGPFALVGEAGDGKQAVFVASSVPVDLALIDLQMPEMDGLEATRRIKEQVPGIKVIMMSMLREPEYEQLALEAGAMAFIPKSLLTAASLFAIFRP